MTAARYKAITDEDWKAVQRGRPKLDRLEELATRLLALVEDEREVGGVIASPRARDLIMKLAATLQIEEWNDGPLDIRRLVTLERCEDFLYGFLQLLHYERGQGGSA